MIPQSAFMPSIDILKEMMTEFKSKNIEQNAIPTVAFMSPFLHNLKILQNTSTSTAAVTTIEIENHDEMSNEFHDDLSNSAISSRSYVSLSDEILSICQSTCDFMMI
jgi:hypothetical protein